MASGRGGSVGEGETLRRTGCAEVNIHIPNGSVAQLSAENVVARHRKFKNNIVDVLNLANATMAALAAS